MQGRHRRRLVGQPAEDDRGALDAEVVEAPAGDAGQRRQQPVVGRHPGRRHREDDVAREREVADRHVAADPAEELAAVAKPEDAGDGEPGQEVRGVRRARRDVVPPDRAARVARVAAEPVLQGHRGHDVAAPEAGQPLVGADRPHLVGREAEVVGDAAREAVDREGQQPRPPVLRELPAPVEPPADREQPEPEGDTDRVVGDADQPAPEEQCDGVRRDREDARVRAPGHASVRR